MTIQMPQLEVWQKEVIDAYINKPKNKWYVVKSVRQVGKSICLQWLLVYASLNKSGSDSLVISPIISQSRKLYNDILKWAGKLVVKSNSTLLTIDFINDSSITFGSAQQGDTLRGKTIRNGGILAVDEAAFINEEFFYEILVPMTNVHQSAIFLFSTPKYKSGLFYNLFTKGLDAHINSRVHSFDWTKYDTSKFLPSETLELYRQQLPKLVFKSEFLGEFIDGDGNVFSDFKNCIVENINLDPDKEIWIGVDWGTGRGQDDTAITIGQYNNDKILIERCITFNDARANETIDNIVRIVEEYVKRGFKDINIIVEKNSIGNVFYDLLIEEVDKYETQYNDNVEWQKEIRIGCGTFTTTNASKERIIRKLIVLFENNLIELPNNEKLINQLSVYECKVSGSNLITYNAPTGAHDDMVISLCLLVGQLYDEVR